METLERKLKAHGLRDTQPRRLVLQALRALGRPSSAHDIQARIDRGNRSVNLVTVYRILEAFEAIGLVHRHPCDGEFTLCSLPDTHGHHGFLHCTSCGNVKEFSSEPLCTIEDRIARTARFQPVSHVSEILGTCSSCSCSC